MNDTTSSPSALAGITIVDLTSVVFGPYASLILADYGATVIKVEPLQATPHAIRAQPTRKAYLPYFWVPTETKKVLQSI